MYIPSSLLLFALIVVIASAAIDIYRLYGRRTHHDHLLPPTPRSPRG